MFYFLKVLFFLVESLYFEVLRVWIVQYNISIELRELNILKLIVERIVM